MTDDFQRAPGRHRRRGVIGSSIAYHLTALGVTDVVLLERKELTAGTTWHAAGLITCAGMVDGDAPVDVRATPRDLYATLEAETGHSTGFRPIGHLHLATHAPAARDAPPRGGVPARLRRRRTRRSPRARSADLCRSPRTDDILAAASTSPTRAAPTRPTSRWPAPRAPRRAARSIFEGVTGHRLHAGERPGHRRQHRPRRHRVRDRRASPPACGAASSAALPASPSRCRPPSTTTCSPSRSTGVTPDLPVIEDPDRYGYYREEGGGLLVGLFEPVAARPGRSTAPRATSRSPCCRPTGTGWRRSSRSRCDRFPALARRRDPHALLRARVLHRRPARRCWGSRPRSTASTSPAG